MKSTRRIMGMPVTLEVPDGNDRAAAMEAAFDRLMWVDKVFSTYKPDSQISRLNRGELKAGQLDSEVRGVLAACEKMRKVTGGYFDIRRTGNEIDPSGYVKGWAIGEGAEILRRAGVERYFVDAGGDMQVRGEWRVGIRNPFNRQEIVKALRVSNVGVATSGTYERGEHIYDPHTGKPATGLASLTVVGPDIVTADVYATAAFAMGANGAEWVAAQGLECYAIAPDGTATFTPGLRQLFL
ncbi:MAG TPA: FAD:protein FMN transferase [Candidatus Saccharimonadia bacterium]|jgi:thiamine biosynthesis lipoprotein